MTCTSGEETRYCTPVWPRDSAKTLTTPGGNDVVSEMISAMRLATRAVCPGILMATVLPAASAGPKERMHRTTGEFHGTMIPTTPAGSMYVLNHLPGDT